MTFVRKRNLADGVLIYQGDNRDVLRGMADASVDSVVTDPPYALVSIGKRYGKPDSAPTKHEVYARASAGFMGKDWDTGETAFAAEFWSEVLRVLKPGGHVLAFSGTRTYHRMVVAIEDAGFEIRDQVGWAYGSGFPKSHDVSKGIDRAAGAEREVVGSRIADDIRGGNFVNQESRTHVINITAPATDDARRWQGWGTALKPAWEPICVARKPLVGTVAENVLAHGTGALNIDGCRVRFVDADDKAAAAAAAQRLTHDQNANRNAYGRFENGEASLAPYLEKMDAGRWPANLIHDGSDDVAALAGNAARFFYCAKASRRDRGEGNTHPTVKPTDLMRYLCRLVTPPGGVVLDPFMGSGSTGKGAVLEGFRFVGIDREPPYFDIAARRIAEAIGGELYATDATDEPDADSREAMTA